MTIITIYNKRTRWYQISAKTWTSLGKFMPDDQVVEKLFIEIRGFKIRLL